VALLATGIVAACGDVPGALESEVEDEPIGEIGQRLSGAEIDAAAQSGVSWVVPDTVAWAKANNCAACHRVGGPLYGASLSAHTGYNVNTSDLSGTGWLAKFLAVTEQQPDGGWTHGGSYRFAKSGHAVFGLAGYTEYTSTAYLSDLQKGVDWAIGATAPYNFSFPNDGLALAGTTSKYVPEDHVSYPVNVDWTHPTAHFAIAAQTVAQVNTALTPADKAKYENFANSLANSLEAKYARSNNAWTVLGISHAALGVTAVGRTPTNNATAVKMRDEILSRHVAGQGWGDASIGSPNVLSTGEALYALCRLGVRSDENQAVFDGLNWLASKQCAPSNNYCSTGSAALNGSWAMPPYQPDIPTIYAVMAMGCYGTLNVDVKINPASATMQPLLPNPQTTTFDVIVTNTGYAANAYTVNLGGTWAGITQLSQTNPSFTLQPKQTATSTVTVELGPNQPGSVVIPITSTVNYSTSSGVASKTLTFNINIPQQPNTQAKPTTTTIVSGNGVIVSPGSFAHLAATVKDINSVSVSLGTLTFYGGGSAIATVQADAQGVFAYDWFVPANAPLGLQSFSATYGGYATPDFSINLAPSSASGTFTVGNGPGTTCQFNVDCLSGFCVDGVCCNSACGGGNPNDCQACSKAAGAPSDGTCGIVAAGTVCRAAADVCDVAETCSGVSTACPSDSFKPAGTVCRDAVDECDVAEACSGNKASCPGDTIAPDGSVCSAGMCQAGACTTAIVTLAAGVYHSLALKSDGTVWATGYNDYGSLGDGTTISHTTPVQVQGLNDVEVIAAGKYHSLALRSDGSVWAWGSNVSGQLGDGTMNNRPSPIMVSGLPVVKAISAGDYHSLAVAVDGTVWAWGHNAHGQLGNGSINNAATPVQVNGLSGMTAIAAGAYHSLAVGPGGEVWAWGQNVQGQLGDGTNAQRETPVLLNSPTNVVAVAGGYLHSLALDANGAVWGWGFNYYGQLGDGSTTSRTTAAPVIGLGDVVAIASTKSFSTALRTDGKVWAWGSNSNGQLGDGTTVSRVLPTQVAGLDGVFALATGHTHTLAVNASGVWAWGNNTYGQLGDGTSINHAQPALMSMP